MDGFAVLLETAAALGVGVGDGLGVGCTLGVGGADGVCDGRGVGEGLWACTAPKLLANIAAAATAIISLGIFILPHLAM